MPREKKEMATNDSAVLDNGVTESAVTEQSAETSKRKRVDVTALDPNEKVTLSFQVPAGLKLAVRKAAEAEGKSEADFARQIMAARMEYEIPAEFNERTGRGQYAGMTEEEKKAKQAQENAEKRDTVTALLEKVHSGEIDPELVKALGIDISKLPKPRSAKERAEDAAKANA